MTLWIGLTGGIGSGKSQAAKIFSDLGVPHIDADALSRNLTADNGIVLPAIRRLFGDKVFHTQNSLNRAALRDLAFRRPQAKAYLACCWKSAQAMPPPSTSTANTVLSKQAGGKIITPCTGADMKTQF